MNRLLLVLVFAGLSAQALLGQITKGRTPSSATPQTSLSPTPSVSKSAKTTSPAPNPLSSERNGSSHASQNRTSTLTTTYGNTTSKRPAQERAARPSAELKTNRPSTYAPPTTATAAKGGSNGAQKVAPLKASERGTVKWMTIEQALERSKTEKRKFFIDMYTDWCGWCKHMDSTTFVNAKVANYLNEHYYPVKFNAEQEKDIVFMDKTYKFKKNGTHGYHELAAFWLNNRLSFPTVVFLDENQQLIQPVPGYQDAAKMEAIINYFGSDSHKKTPWESYEKNFVNKK